MTRSNSCQSSSLEQNLAKLRRKRNLTTSFNIQNQTTVNQREYCLDKFLDSLEDINNYLDKKLTQLNHKKYYQTNQAKPHSRKSRRYFTQPIVLHSNNISDTLVFN